ncbi:MAG: hypothetical protein ACLFSW_06745 [Halobacteriales archaeon]
MKRNGSTEAVTETSGYILVFAGFLLLILSLAIGNVVMAERFLSNMGLAPIARNSSIMLWGGLAAVVVGVLIVVTADVDVDVE